MIDDNDAAIRAKDEAIRDKKSLLVRRNRRFNTR